MSPSDDSVIDTLSDFPVFNPRKWVECKIKEPTKKQITSEAVETAYRLHATASIQSEDFEPILRAVQHSSKVVRDVGAELLKTLAKKHNIVLEIIKELLNSKDSKIRFTVIAHLCSSYPRDFLIEIVGRGLDDRSSSVRLIAADACVGIGLRELLPLLENLLLTEKDQYLEDVKRHIGILKDGYHLSHSSGRPWLSFKNTKGEIIAIMLKKEQLDNEDLLTIVAKEMQMF